jgi:hypothetical protein
MQLIYFLEMKRPKILLVLAFTILMAKAESADSPSSDQQFLFMSGKISAEVKDNFFPLKSFDGKKLRLDGSGKAIRLSKNLNCSMRPVVVTSSSYADIRGFEYSLGSNSDKFHAMMAASEMNAEQMRYEAGNEFETATGAAGSASLPGTGNDKEWAELDELTKTQIDDEFQKSGMNNWVDNVYGQCSIVSNKNLKNAYAALVLSFDASGKKGSKNNRVTFVRLKRVGEIDANIEQTFKFDCEFPEIRALSSLVEVFLFDGKNMPVATNRSRGLQRLSSEQVEEFRELQKKQGKK